MTKLLKIAILTTVFMVGCKWQEKEHVIGYLPPQEEKNFEPICTCPDHAPTKSLIFIVNTLCPKTELPIEKEITQTWENELWKRNFKHYCVHFKFGYDDNYYLTYDVPYSVWLPYAGVNCISFTTIDGKLREFYGNNIFYEAESVDLGWRLKEDTEENRKILKEWNDFLSNWKNCPVYRSEKHKWQK